MKRTNFLVIAITVVFLVGFLCNSARAQWQPLTEPLGEFEQYLNMCFTNDSTGYVLYQHYQIDTLYHKVLKTTDYGLHWISILDIAQENNPLSNYLSDIFFINEDIGWICGYNMPFIFKTIDGGQSWQQYAVNGADSFEQIAFANNTLGFALEGFSGSIGAKTTDGGLTWEAALEAGGNDITYYDSCNYVIIGSGYFSNVSNCEYELIDFSSINELADRNGRCIYIKNTNEWVVGSIGLIGANNFGSILTTNDGGENFTILDLPFSAWISELYFLNPEVGYATATNTTEIPCTILKTFDGGLSWNCQGTPILTNEQGETYYAYFFDMDLRNENLMYAMDQNIIYRTTNGGGPLGDTYTGVKVTPHKPKTLSLFPNPTSTSFRIEATQANEVRAIEIYNATGQIIAQYTTVPNEMDVRNWPSGCYNVVVKYDNEVVRTRVVVE
jgi:photosystem II stability/assembly factor-like uncharacterized protein